jgi:small redox-active disulfide protein 2
MKIAVLGTGCKNCKKLIENVTEATGQFEVDFEISKVEDLDEILKYDVFLTPALVIDDEVVSTGKVVSVETITEMIKERL